MQLVIDLYHEIFCFLAFVLVFIIVWVFYIIKNFSSAIYVWQTPFFFIPKFLDYRGYLRNITNNKSYFLFLGKLVLSSWAKQRCVKGIMWEVILTVIPSVFLICICLPSLGLIYNLEKYSNILSNLSYTIKIIGNQWYWVYEYNNFFGKKEVLNSLMLSIEDILHIGVGYRLLDVDFRLCITEGQYWQVLILSSDVIHSWSMPSLGIKLDACPGRLNKVFVKSWRCGVFYGQCSEICGIYHAFMPIVVETFDFFWFLNTITKTQNV